MNLETIVTLNILSVLILLSLFIEISLVEYKSKPKSTKIFKNNDTEYENATNP